MLAPLAFANKAEIEDNGAEPEYSAEACPLEQADVCKDVHEYVNAVINGADDKVLSTLAAIDDEKVLKFYLSRRISWNSYSELDTELSRLYKRLDKYSHISPQEAELLIKDTTGASYSQINYLLLVNEYNLAINLVSKYGRFIDFEEKRTYPRWLKKPCDCYYNDAGAAVELIVSNNNISDKKAMILVKEMINYGAYIQAEYILSFFKYARKKNIVVKLPLLKYIIDNYPFAHEDKTLLEDDLKELYTKRAKKLITFDGRGNIPIHFNNKKWNREMLEEMKEIFNK
ncbi:MAG: hypothetical protein LBG16_00910 [Elusimicrobiota bacterium]|nr:hypothetical protein [Elusimicrobiota bacterium]